jgi:hypothetical protein
VFASLDFFTGIGKLTTSGLLTGELIGFFLLVVGIHVDSRFLR